MSWSKKVQLEGVRRRPTDNHKRSTKFVCHWVSLLLPHQSVGLVGEAIFLEVEDLKSHHRGQ